MYIKFDFRFDGRHVKSIKQNFSGCLSMLKMIFKFECCTLHQLVLLLEAILNWKYEHSAANASKTF